MGLEKELHVVIKLPFKKPSGFVKPPPVAWTEDMEHQLWKHIKQKHTDWNYIAEQFGVPAPYLVRHAAFMYETQLRGVQQQLRLSGAGNPISISSSPPPHISTSTSSSTANHSNVLSNQSQARLVSTLPTSLEKPAQDHQVGDAMAVATTLTAARSTNTSVNNTVRDPITIPSIIHTSPIYRQGDNRHLIANWIPTDPSSSNMDVEIAAMASATAYQYQHLGRAEPMIPTAIYNVAPSNIYDCRYGDSNNRNDTDLPSLAPPDDERNDIINTGQQLRNQRNQAPDITKTSLSSITGTCRNGNMQTNRTGIPSHHNEDQDEKNGGQGDCNDRAKIINTNGNARIVAGGRANGKNDSNIDDDDDDDGGGGGFINHFEKMKLEKEEPAFLPYRKIEGSQLLGSLRASVSRSRSTQQRMSSISLETSAHQLDSPKTMSQPSSFEQPVLTAHTVPEQASTHHYGHQQPSSSSSENEDHRSIKTANINTDTDDKDNKSKNNKSNTINVSKRKMVFGPNINRANLAEPSNEANKDTNSALSSFSDLSDYSVTRSAMEDAILSKLNIG